MTSLKDILPESVIPSKSKKEYTALKKKLKNIQTKGWEKNKEIIIAEMSAILNTVEREEVKKSKLKAFTTMINNIKKTKKSVNHTKKTVAKTTYAGGYSTPYRESSRSEIRDSTPYHESSRCERRE